MIATHIVELHTPVTHPNYARHALGERGVVSDYDDRGAMFTIDLEKQFVNGVARGAIQVTCWFVGKDQLGVEGERARHGDSLLLAAREFTRTV